MALTRLDMGGAQDEGLPSLTRVLTSSRTVSGNISPTVTGLSGLSHALGAGPRIIEDAYLSKEMCIRVIGKGGGKLLKKNIMKAIKTYFDHCKLTHIKLYLNSKFYPYDNLNIDFDKYKTAVLYDMYVHFRTSYYQIFRENRETLLNMENFLYDVTLIFYTNIFKVYANVIALDSATGYILEIDAEYTFHSRSIFSENLVAIELRKLEVKFTKIVLNPHDNKRYIVLGSTDTLPWGGGGITDVK
ncbi:hypothetical protein ALC56_02885 [Trachymyrmex septentrionalis]|uniref:Double jelly roll-like domain-containing protein n=1 Tax=Trachymyrmex septentrionalis TaxID=34720 RepID=A0A151K095_9HYME|nr:hypothetical protein ALC56_02885 [Trachymyrmex septentrionalis]